jgi:hypothetical protein
VLVLSGCGSSSGGGKSLTKAEFAAKANTICANYLLKSSALGGTTVNEAEAVKLMVGIRALYAKSIADMKKLVPPAAEQATVGQAVKISEQQLGWIDQQIAAMRKHDTAGLNKAILRSKSIKKQSNAAFSRLGATSCIR